MAMTQTPGYYPDPAGGGGQRWWDGWQWTERTLPEAPGSPAPKQKRVWLRVLIVLGVLGLLGIGGCSVLLVAGGKAVEDATDQYKVDEAARQAEIAKDVSVGLCALDDLGMLAASGTITNHSSERSNYTVSVVFIDDDGKQVAEGFTSVGNVAPGRTADWSASSFQTFRYAKCEVAEVTRYSDEP